MLARSDPHKIRTQPCTFIPQGWCHAKLEHTLRSYNCLTRFQPCARNDKPSYHADLGHMLGGSDSLTGLELTLALAFTNIDIMRNWNTCSEAQTPSHDVN